MFEWKDSWEQIPNRQVVVTCIVNFWWGLVAISDLPFHKFVITCHVQMWKKPTYCNQSNTEGRKGLGAGLGESMVDLIHVTPEYILLVKLVLRDQWLTCIMTSHMRAGIKLWRHAIENVWEFCTPPDNHCCNLWSIVAVVTIFACINHRRIFNCLTSF